jgi:hypothetical protein
MNSPSGVVERRPYTGLQAEYAELQREQRRIRARLRELRGQLAEGVCEVCGGGFTRTRATRRFCSSACTLKFHVEYRKGQSYSIPEIRAAWPAIVAAGLLTARNAEICLQVMASCQNTHAASEEIGLSHQRVSQVLIKATRMARLVARVNEASLAQRQAKEI